MPRLVAAHVDRPRLLALLDHAVSCPVTLVCAPAGSGKTVLVSSWLRAREMTDPVAWVGVDRGESDATRFWGAIVDALRDSGAVAPARPLATLAPAPGDRGAEFQERVLDGLRTLAQPTCLVLDDLHELRSKEALDGLARLLEQPPPQLRTFVLSRRDPQLGLHRLRLSGELLEIRATDLAFSDQETVELMAATGVAVAERDAEQLRERTEGWAAGLRLAAMSLSRHEAPERFVAEFSGSERTVAAYLLDEVLTRLPDAVRTLLLRTCVLERVSGPLADRLTGGQGSIALLQELEEANAFVVPLDVGRSWFRYHHLLADLLRLELRREAPEEVPRLHRRAAAWFAEHGHPVEAIRHAERGEDWELAAELLARHWTEFVLDGEEETLGSLLAGLPGSTLETDAEMAAIAAADRLARSRWAEAGQLLAVAGRAIPAVPEARRHRAETAVATVQLLQARRLADVETGIQAAGAMFDGEGADETVSVELRALGLMNLGLAENGVLRLKESSEHLERALALGRQVKRAYIELGCLVGLGVVATMSRRSGEAEDLLRQAIELADRLGWSNHPNVAVGCVTLGQVLIDRGGFEEGEQLLERAEPILVSAPELAGTVALRHAQGMLEFGRGRFAEALAAFRDGERLVAQLRAPHFLGEVERQWQLRAQLRLGEIEPARGALEEARAAGMSGSADWCNLEALVRLQTGDAAATLEAVAPVLAGEAYVVHVNREIEAWLLDGLARQQLEDVKGARDSVERALELAECQGSVWVFLTVGGAAELLEAHPVHTSAHGAHIRLLLDRVAGVAEPPGAEATPELSEALSERELAVLRFMPTNLSAAEIGAELFLSVHTVKTHMRRLYAKLDVHTRAEAVQRGRALGLLAPGLRGR